MKAIDEAVAEHFEERAAIFEFEAGETRRRANWLAYQSAQALRAKLESKGKSNGA